MTEPRSSAHEEAMAVLTAQRAKDNHLFEVAADGLSLPGLSALAAMANLWLTSQGVTTDQMLQLIAADVAARESA